MSTLREDLIAAGPKEVRTPNMTVVSHDPMQVVRANERRSTVMPSLCCMRGCSTTPNDLKYKMFYREYITCSR